MRITYRKNDSFAYWTQRWADVEADEAMENRASYPLKYALEAVARSFAPNGGRICEAGCGNGRLVRYFMRNGYHIRGFDFIPEAIVKLKTSNLLRKWKQETFSIFPIPMNILIPSLPLDCTTVCRMNFRSRRCGKRSEF